MARVGEVTGGESKQVPLTVSQLEFTRRWCLHVLPAGYTRTRRFGGWSNTRREQFLELFAKQLESTEAKLPAGATDFGPFEESADESQTEIEIQLCKTCGCSLIPHSQSPRRSWATIMDSHYRPHWYTRC